MITCPALGFLETIISDARPVFSMHVGKELTDGLEKYVFRAELDALVRHFQLIRGDVSQVSARTNQPVLGLTCPYYVYAASHSMTPHLPFQCCRAFEAHAMRTPSADDIGQQRNYPCSPTILRTSRCRNSHAGAS